MTLDPSQAHRHFFAGNGSFDADLGSSAGATASNLSTDGRSFTVNWSANVGPDSLTRSDRGASSATTGRKRAR